jgi:hypothetical protein
MNLIFRLVFVVLAASLSFSVLAQTSQPVFDDWFLITKDQKFKKPAGFVHATGSWVEVKGKRLYKLQKTQEIDTTFLFIRFDITSDEVAYYDDEGLLGAKVDFTRGDKVIEIVGKRSGDLFSITQTTTEDGESTVVTFSKSLDDVKYTSFDALKPVDVGAWTVGTEKAEQTFIFLKEELIEFKFESLGRRFENVRGETTEITAIEISGPQDSEIWYNNQGQRIAGKQRLGSFYRVNQQVAEGWKQSK